MNDPSDRKGGGGALRAVFFRDVAHPAPAASRSPAAGARGWGTSWLQVVRREAGHEAVCRKCNADQAPLGFKQRRTGIVAATIFIAFLLGLYTILWKCMSFQAKRDYAGQQFFFPQSLLPEKKIEDYDRQLQAEHKDHFRFAVGVGESLN
ncbi:uncharacterized protein [Narcine bancroftii]|uniref:uncharacterized protein isoform X1 n=1 Tax=Narcine bancroftii TaxID=1343680 RepID=UPI00383210EC